MKTGKDRWAQWVKHTGKVLALEVQNDKHRPLPESAKRHMQHVPYGGKPITLTEGEAEHADRYNNYRPRDRRWSSGQVQSCGQVRKTDSGIPGPVRMGNGDTDGADPAVGIGGTARVDTEPENEFFETLKAESENKFSEQGDK